MPGQIRDVIPAYGLVVFLKGRVPQAQKGFRFGGILERECAAGAMKASIRFGGVLDGPCAAGAPGCWGGWPVRMAGNRRLTKRLEVTQPRRPF